MIYFYLLPVDYLLTAGVKVVIYSGQLDIICATQGMHVCVHACMRAFVYVRACMFVMPGYVSMHKIC